MVGSIIRQYCLSDSQAIEDITYRTGFKGEDLTGRRFFDDKYLFYLIFIYYYTHFEPKNCFIADAINHHQIIGYVCGTTDTEKKELQYKKVIHRKILRRIITHTTWRYPKTLLTLLNLSRIQPRLVSSVTTDIILSYPAHLHVNILPEYQRSGLGTRLIHHFEEYISQKGVRGVHLQTTNYNRKAVPFYKKLGYHLLNDIEIPYGFREDLRLLTFGKVLGS